MIRRSIQSLLIWAGLAAVVCAPSAHAVTITSCDENTVKKAVATLSATFGVDCSLTLTSPINIPVSPFFPITFIRGNGFAVKLSGGNSVGVINAPHGAALILSDVTITNGRTSSSTGGGISNAGSLEVTGCTFIGNTNAILNTGNLSVKSSTFTGNAAPSGGAIIHTGPQAYIANSSFGTTTPSSGNGGGQTGGAIYVSGTSAEIDNSNFYGNIATQGGAIYAYLSTLTLAGDYFQGNTTNPGGSGGAIANLGSSVTITNTSASSGGFQSNQAASSSTTAGLGGAIYNAGVETFSCGTFCFAIFHAPSLTLNTVYLSKNSAAHGGAIYSLGNTGLFGSSGGITKVVDSYFFENGSTGFGTTYGMGGAIDNDGISQLSVSGSTFEAGGAGFGDSIRNAHGSLNVSNSTFFEAFCCTADALDNESTTAVVEYSTFYAYQGIGGSGKVELKSTILMGVGITCAKSSNIIDGGYNLETVNLCGFDHPGSTSQFNTNPNINIFSFGFNGGPTPTWVLPTGSPAIDKIPGGTLSCGVLNTPGGQDQRGVSRPQGLLCDIGAIEHLFSNLPTSSTTCDGIYNKTFDGDITVLPGQKCVFLGGGITGNVLVKGARFELRYATVGGNVEIDGDSTFSIGPSATITGTLEIHNLSAGAAQNQVCGANVHSHLQVHNNAAAVAIGTQDQSSCQGNTVGGSMDVHNNSASTTVDGNTISGDFQDHNNTGPTEVFKNLIKGNLNCHQNTSITGGLDSAKQKEGQCASF
jgi:predicted outer membrane repeat protein